MDAIYNLTFLELKKRLDSEPLEDLIKEYKNQTLSSTMLFDLYENFRDDLNTTIFISAYPNASSKLLNTIATEWGDESILINLAKHDRTLPEVLQRLAASEFINVKKTLAQNKNITPIAAKILSSDSNIIVRALLAENPTLFPSIQLKLADDSSECVTISLLRNKKIIPKAQEIIENKESILIKLALLLNKNLDDSQLQEYADNALKEIQELLFIKEDIPDKVLESLTFSQYEDIAIKALKKKVLSEAEFVGWAKNDNYKIKKVIAAKKQLPDLVQELLAEDTETEVLLTIAANPSINDNTAKIIIENGNTTQEVLIVLANNSAISESIIDQLISLQDFRVNKMLILKRKLNKEQLITIINSAYKEEIIYFIIKHQNSKICEISREITRKLITSKLPSLRAFAAQSENISQSEIAKLAYDKENEVLEKLINNRLISATTLNFLKEKKDEYISELAQKKLENYSKISTTEQQKTNSIMSKIINVIKR